MIDGLWGGYEIEFTFDGSNYRASTKTGVRGFNIPVTVNKVGNTFEFFHKGNKISIEKIIKYVEI